MKEQTLMHSSILAAVFVAAIMGVSMLTGFPGTAPFISVNPASDKITGGTLTASSSGQYVRINPVTNAKFGEALTISGTSNLPNGTNLLVQVYPASFEQSIPDNGVFSGAEGAVDVRTGSGGVGTWSLDIDTSQLQPTKYLVNVSVLVAMNPPGDIETRDPSDRTMFTIQPGLGNAAHPGSDNAVAGGILIDPVKDTVQGKQLLEVTGKTNLSAGTDLLVKINPVTTQDGKLTADLKCTENAAVIKVVKGDGINNRFHVWLDTRSLPLSDHIVTISEMQDPSEGILSETRGCSGSAIFNLIAGTYGTTPSGQSVTDLSVPGIFINPVDDVTAGDTVIISGTTTLPAGSEFLIQVIRDPMDETAIRKNTANPEFRATISAVRGSSTGTNLFSVPVQTKGFSPGRHILSASADKDKITGSILFTIK